MCKVYGSILIVPVTEYSQAVIVMQLLCISADKLLLLITLLGDILVPKLIENRYGHQIKESWYRHTSSRCGYSLLGTTRTIHCIICLLIESIILVFTSGGWSVQVTA